MKKCLLLLLLCACSPDRNKDVAGKPGQPVAGNKKTAAFAESLAAYKYRYEECINGFKKASPETTAAARQKYFNAVKELKLFRTSYEPALKELAAAPAPAGRFISFTYMHVFARTIPPCAVLTPPQLYQLLLNNLRINQQDTVLLCI